MKKITLLLIAMLVTMLSVSMAFAAGATLKADLSGKNEVPSVKTKAKGEAKFTLSDDGKKLSYTLVLRDIENPTAAHIHLGEAGKTARRWQLCTMVRKKKANSGETLHRQVLRIKI